MGAGAFAIIVVVCWLAQTIKDWFLGTVSVAHTLYLCSHLVLFGGGYLAIDNINHGWLVLTIWQDKLASRR